MTYQSTTNKWNCSVILNNPIYVCAYVAGEHCRANKQLKTLISLMLPDLVI